MLHLVHAGHWSLVVDHVGWKLYANPVGSCSRPAAPCCCPHGPLVLRIPTIISKVQTALGQLPGPRSIYRTSSSQFSTRRAPHAASLRSARPPPLWSLSRALLAADLRYTNNAYQNTDRRRGALGHVRQNLFE